MKKFILLALAANLLVTNVFSQYNIELEIKGEKDKDVYLASHLGESKYAVDTARLDKKGNAVFKGDKSLNPGMYLFVVGDGQIMDFLISDEKNQTFSVSTTKDKYTEDAKFKNSPENEVFSAYIKFLLEQMNSAKKIEERYQKNPSDKIKDELVKEMELQKKQRKAKIDEIGAQYPNSFLHSVVAAVPVTLEPENIPEEIRNMSEESEEFRKYQYEYFKAHYFDNMNLADIRMQHTPILIPALEYYFNKVLPPIPDTIINNFDRMFAKTKGDTAMAIFLTGYVMDNFSKSTTMGLENVVVHIIDNYYLSGKVTIDSEKFMTNITQYAASNRESLIGKQSKELKMEAINGTYESLYDIDAPYTLVYFYEPTCGFCKQETPKIYALYEQYKDKNLKALCVYVGNDKQEWLSYITSNKMTDWINVWDPQNSNNYRTVFNLQTLPQIYLLDKDKKIIGRRLDSANLAKMLDHSFK